MSGTSTTSLKQSQGEILTAVVGLFYIPLGETDISQDCLDQLRMTFGSISFRIRCSANGDGLTIDGRDLRPTDLGEYGTMRMADCSQYPVFDNKLGLPLLGAQPITSLDSRYELGVILSFSTGPIVLCNWGDELKVWDLIPESLFAAEGIQISEQSGGE